MRDLTIGAVCMNSPVGDVEGNLGRMERFVREASEKGVDVICFPELSVTGYVLEDPERVCPPSLSREIVRRVAAMARAEKMIVIAGLIESTEKEGSFISQVVAGPDHELGLYRKTHLSPREKKSYRPGQKLEVFYRKDTRFGVQLCYEAHFPEISTLMALKGAEILFIPHASPRGGAQQKMQSWMRHLPARAFDNGVYVVACNQVGHSRGGFSFPGAALALNPAGRVIVSYTFNKEKMVLAKLPGEELQETREHEMKYFLPNRRPELYEGIGPETKPVVAPVRPMK